MAKLHVCKVCKACGCIEVARSSWRRNRRSCIIQVKMRRCFLLSYLACTLFRYEGNTGRMEPPSLLLFSKMLWNTFWIFDPENNFSDIMKISNYRGDLPDISADKEKKRWPSCGFVAQDEEDAKAGMYNWFAQCQRLLTPLRLSIATVFTLAVDRKSVV